MEADTSLGSERVVRCWTSSSNCAAHRSGLRIDNGPEFQSQAVGHLGLETRSFCSLSRPGKPTQNGQIQIVQWAFSSGVPESGIVHKLKEAGRLLRSGASSYNTKRPHSSLGMCRPGCVGQAARKRACNLSTCDWYT